MARINAILKALTTALWRDWSALGAFASNPNFVVMVYLLRTAGAFVYLTVFVVLLFPLSADPLRKIPPERLALWPLDPRQARILRLASPWVNPVTWLFAGLTAWALRSGRVSVGLLAAVAMVIGAGFLLPGVPDEWMDRAARMVPDLGGRLGQLMRKDLRQTLTTLDFYFVAILAAAAAAYRLSAGEVPAEMPVLMTLLIVMSLSSLAQNLFGLDGESGMTRYRLLPLRGWQILAAKDAVFLLVVALFSLALSPLTGMAAGMVALSVSHAPSVRKRRNEARWRFYSGAGIGTAAFQAIAMGSSGAAAHHWWPVAGPLVLLPCLAVCASSAWWHGRLLERAA